MAKKATLEQLELPEKKKRLRTKTRHNQLGHPDNESLGT